MRQVHVLILVFIFSIHNLFAQSNAGDKWVGQYLQEESGLSLVIHLAIDGVYKGSVNYQGAQYPFEGFKLLGSLTGAYEYQGNSVDLTLSNENGAYSIYTEGVTLPVRKTSDDPKAGAGASASGTSSPGSGDRSSGSSSINASTDVPAATGTRMKDPFGAYSFATAAGWTASESDGTFSVQKQGDGEGFAVSSHGYNSIEEIVSSLEDVTDHESGTYLEETHQAYGPNGVLVRYDGRTSEGQVVIEVISMVSPHGGGVTIMGAGLAVNYKSSYTTVLKSMANSVQFTKPVISAAAQQWKTKFTGKKLTYFYTGNGMSEELNINLCSNGRFAKDGNTSYTSGGYADFSSVMSDKGYGSWKIVSKGSESVLLLHDDSGTTSGFSISAGSASNEVLLNEKRFFVQAGAACD